MGRPGGHLATPGAGSRAPTLRRDPVRASPGTCGGQGGTLQRPPPAHEWGTRGVAAVMVGYPASPSLVGVTVVGPSLAGHGVVLVAVPELAQVGGVRLGRAGAAAAAETGEWRHHLHPLGRQRALDGLAELRAPRFHQWVSREPPNPSDTAPLWLLTSLRDTMPTRRPMLVT